MRNIERTGIKGIVRIELKDRAGNSKKLFQTNKLWSLLHKLFNIDLRISHVTGSWTTNGLFYNTITDAGLAVCAKRLGGVTEDAITHMAIGIGTPSATALGSEIATGGGERAGVTPTSQTTTVTGDTIRSTNTYAFTDAFAITEEGLFNASSDGDMVASRNFSAINVTSGDSLQVTHDIVMSAS